MIEVRRQQLSFGEGLIAEEIDQLREPWMPHADRLLEDEQLLTPVFDALSKRHCKSRTRGRLGTPAEIVLRLLLLKHIRNWSYAVLEREVRANLVYRDFTRVGGAKVPDAKTMVPETIGQRRARGGASQTVLPRDRRRGETISRCDATSFLGRSAQRTGNHRAAAFNR